MANKRFEIDQGLKIGSNFVIDEATGDISTAGNLHITGTGGLTFSENLKLSVSQGGTGVGTQQDAINALAGAQTTGYYLRGNGTNVVMAALNPSDLSSAVAIIKGGTGQTNQQAAINALVGSQTSGYYLRSDGTNVTMSPLSMNDITGTVPISSGGTGAITASAAFTALAPSQTGNSGKFLTTNGTVASWATIEGALPTQTGNNGKVLSTDGSSASWVTVTAGTDISVTSNSTAITVNDTSTLSSVTGRGATTNAVVSFTNSTAATSTSTGAVKVSGGVGVTGNVHAANLVGNVSTNNITSTEAGTINVTGNLVPTTDVIYDLGTPSKRFKTLYLAGNTIDLGGALITTTDISLLLTAKSGATFEISGNANEKVSGSFSNLTVDSGAISTSTTTGALLIAGGLGVTGNVHAEAIYDNSSRVITSITSAGPGGLSVVTGSGPIANITLNTAGTAGTYGNSSAIPVITTDSYGRVTTVTLATDLSASTANVATRVSSNLTVGSGLQLTSGSTFDGAQAQTISSTDTLQTVTARGATTTASMQITNSTASTSTSTGALKVSGGLGVAGNVNAGSVYADNYFYANGTVLSTGGGAGGVAGVSSIAGTANQITASASTGAVTLSLPQNIHTGATPTFGSLTLNGQATANTFVDKKAAVSISSNLLTLDLSQASTFELTLDQSITQITISNVPNTTNGVIQFVLIITADGTARSITWPNSVLWPSSTAPTLTSTLNKKDIFVFVSTDSGTSWEGITAGQNY